MISKRVKKLKKEIISKLPSFPNNKETKDELESKSLTDLLIIYLNWSSRLIVPRRRVIEIEPDVYKDPKWTLLSDSFLRFEEKSKNGDDINPYLSKKAHEKGFTPAASASGSDVDRWEDKDRLLNVMGFHHFHLGALNAGSKLSERQNDVVFAKVDKLRIHILGVFDHSVFDSADPTSMEISQERKRLWQLFDNYSSQDAPPNSIVIPGNVSTSGTSLKIVQLAQSYTRIINQIDPKLDDREFVKSEIFGNEIQAPSKPKIQWHLRGTDIGVFDSQTNSFVLYGHGLN
ncbi:hypothetical protein [Teredinibacter sp. KSP-S5-2]|uniref:hypothetical protein n=1 Tax=Teredinibacter sp. KSP-S5-2 TaxID=3034506 RepID=UPI00293533B4|nr:hypothetical protein [Teredinibacter sp. KSP-S5-2]WNO10481.1 hypothetical protein P5V12_04780 [Teredinibacter sp. KSP-S5-2]